MSAPEHQQHRRVQRFSRDVLHASVVDLTSKALTGLGLGLLGTFALLVVYGGSVPAWLLAVVLLVAIGTLLYSHSRSRRAHRDLKAAKDRVTALEPLEKQAPELARQLEEAQRDLGTCETRIGELEPYEAEAPELERTVRIYEWALDRFEDYTAHIAEVLDHLQRVVSGDLNIAIPVYIERGILEPARNLLAPAGEAVRLSVLLPTDDVFVMAWAAGHSLPGQEKYRVPIKDTLSHLAYETGAVHRWHDAQQDDRFQQNPRATWPTHAMVSIPVRRGDRVVGVFNAVAAEPGAFDPAEERYLVSLGSIISVAASVWLDQEERKRLPRPGS